MARNHVHVLKVRKKGSRDVVTNIKLYVVLKWQYKNTKICWCIHHSNFTVGTQVGTHETCYLQESGWNVSRYTESIIKNISDICYDLKGLSLRFNNDWLISDGWNNQACSRWPKLRFILRQCSFQVDDANYLLCPVSKIKKIKNQIKASKQQRNKQARPTKMHLENKAKTSTEKVL